MKTVKRLKNITFIISLAFLAQSCMPDSLTKFQEDQTKKSTDGGASDDTGTVTNTGCVIGSDIECTSPGTYTMDEIIVTHDQGGALSTIDESPILSSLLSTDHFDYITFTDTTTSTINAVTGLSLDTGAGDIAGTVRSFVPKTTFNLSYAYDSPDDPTYDATASTTVDITMSRKPGSFTYASPDTTKGFGSVVLTLSNVTNFAVNGKVSTIRGASGTVTYIDTSANELYVTLDSTGFNFVSGENVDNSATFFNTEASISSVLYIFKRDSSGNENRFDTTFIPVLDNTMDTTQERESLQFSISPSIDPGTSGISFNQFTGHFGGTIIDSLLGTGATTTTTTGSRMITASAAIFGSSSVGDIITVSDGTTTESQVIAEVDASNLIVYTYAPFTNSITSGNIYTRVTDLAECRSTNELHAATGTVFGTSLAGNPNILVNGSSVISGANYTITSSTQLTLVGTCTGYGMTSLQSLTNNSYSITARSITNSTNSISIDFAVLDTTTPRTLNSIAIDQKAGQTIVLTLSDASSFSVGDSISNQDTGETNQTGTVATINGINGNIVYATITAEAVSDDTKNPVRLFTVNDAVDNAATFGNSKATISAVEYTAALTDAIGVQVASGAGFIGWGVTLELDPYYDFSDTDDEAEYATIEFNINPSLTNAPGLNFASKSICYTAGNDFPACTSCTEDTTNTDITSCTGAGGTWVRGGTVFGTPTVEVPSTTYTITATNAQADVFTQDVTISFGYKPSGLAMTRNVLLHVPSNSAFDVGDAISASDGTSQVALGTVVGKWANGGTVGANHPDKSIPTYEFIEVKVEYGEFKEYYDLDNKPTFAAQKTYVLGDGAYYYNVKLTSGVGNNGSFKDSEYSTYAATENVIQVQGAATNYGRVVYNDETSSTGTTGQYTYVALESGSIDSTNTVEMPNITGTPSTALTAISVNNYLVTAAATSADFEEGRNFTTNASAVGTFVDWDSSATSGIISHVEGTFAVGNNIDTDNPYAASLTTISALASSDQYFMYNGDQGTLKAFLDEGNGTDTLFTLSSSEPAGLQMKLTEGLLDGTPTGPSTEETLTLRAANPFGTTTHSFTLEVIDQFKLFDTSGTLSYILHKAGQGHGRTSCSVTKQQMDSSDASVKNITCWLDAGEVELHNNGVKMDIKTGNDLCTVVQETPYSYWQYPAGSTTDPSGLSTGAVYEHTGDTVNCGPGVNGASPTEVITSDAAGANPITNPNTSTTAKKMQEACGYDYSDLTVGGSSLPNCDGGEFTHYTVAWEYDSTVPSCTPTIELQDDPYACGGKTGACVSGPASLVFSDDELSLGINTTVHDLTGSTTNTVNIEYKRGISEFGNNFFYANYTNNCAAAVGGTYYMDVDALQTYADSSSAARAGSYIGQSQPVYTYKCLSGASIKAKVNLVVRDWDRDFKVQLDDGTSIDLYYPSTPGLVASGGYTADQLRQMDNFETDPVFSEIINEYEDLDDAMDLDNNNSTDDTACGAAADSLVIDFDFGSTAGDNSGTFPWKFPGWRE